MRPLLHAIVAVSITFAIIAVGASIYSLVTGHELMLISKPLKK